jgi:DNA topoisomerase III
LPHFSENQTFRPSKLELSQGETSAPKHLTEADLISLMDKNGIGTDATIHEHIKHVQEREYVVKVGQGLVPTRLGFCLVEVYEKLSIELYKPTLRAVMESDMKCIAEGTRSRD